MRDTCAASAATLKPAFAEMGEAAGFDAVALQRYPGLERLEHVHHAGRDVGVLGDQPAPALLLPVLDVTRQGLGVEHVAAAALGELAAALE